MMVMVVMMPWRGERRRGEQHHQREHEKLLHRHHHGTIELNGKWKCDEEESGKKRCRKPLLTSREETPQEW
ncbi:MAG TPA: hypothetical protein VME68_10695 [Acidobacteriaceae bacterium]|nr:hypothetical protein [Acidobacteriaceae bacterium]